MTVTASRLGSAPITIDWSNLARIAVPGAPATSRGPDAREIQEAWSRLKARFDQGEVGFYEAPAKNELSQANESLALAESVLKRRQFTDCLFLGIGGSALGPISLLSALTDRCQSGVRMHFMENPDPTDWKGTIRCLNPETTLVVCVTKSGTTFETMAQFLLALEWLGPERAKTHVIAITDPAKGDLKSFAMQYDIPTLHIAPSMGGRFSVFTPVGLFPAALAGLKVQDFLLGARQVRDHLEKAPLEKNPLFILASELIRHSTRRTVHVCMPYSTRLRLLGSWFVQLWGESLGKDGKGFTPVAAVGATDQHSILQLLRDGPDDKVTFFMTVDKVDDEVRIPKATRGLETGRYPAFKLLQGHTLHELLATEYRATSLVLTKQAKPNLTLQLDRIDERSMGAIFFAFSVLTAVTGTLWGINPFDQPGVEEGKVYIRESLSRDAARPDPSDDDNSPVGRLRRDRG
jgi:glucose-6-phosphate isomerase